MKSSSMLEIQQPMLEHRGSHAVMDLGPRHDLSHLSSERFHWTSRAGGCGKAVRRSSAWLDHQDRIHECSAERRLLCSNMAVRRTVRIHAVRSHRSSHLERRFSACRLMANVLVSRQSTPAIHIWSTQRSNVSRTIGAVDPALASLRCGSQTVRGNQYSFGPRVRSVAALGQPGS